MPHKAVLISVHPQYAELILAGKKRVEFRRTWAATPVDRLVIYATLPVQRIVAIARIKAVVVGSRSKLWNMSKHLGGGISRRQLFTYFDGKLNAVAIELSVVNKITNGLDPVRIFGHDFIPPQSFRYLKDAEYIKLCKLIK